jgi:hypothetical protein
MRRYNATTKEKNPKPPGYLLDTLETTGYSPLSKSRQTLVRRTLAKATTLENTFKLIDQKSPLEKQYWKTYHCGKELFQEGDKFTFLRCKKKWCRTCTNVRTANLINGYKHLLNDFQAPQLMVLTMKNCKGRQLKNTYTKMLEAFKLATRNVTKTHNLKISGIRTWECTYNQETDEYHPHFNVVVESKEAAELIRSYWLSYWTDRVGAKHVNTQAQFITPISKSKDLLEVFKYVTKLAVSHDDETKAQDWIYQCTNGKRLAQAFGSLRKVKIEDKAIQEDIVLGESDIEIWIFEDEVKHYVNSHGETLVSDREKQDYINDKLREKKLREAEKEKPPITPPHPLNRTNIYLN